MTGIEQAFREGYRAACAKTRRAVVTAVRTLRIRHAAEDAAWRISLARQQAPPEAHTPVTPKGHNHD